MDLGKRANVGSSLNVGGNVGSNLGSSLLFYVTTVQEYGSNTGQVAFFIM